MDLTPPAREGYAPYTSKLGKFLPVNLGNNNNTLDKASDTIKTTVPPERVLDGAAYMEKVFGRRLTPYGTGTNGTIYSIKIDAETRDRLNNMQRHLQNTITRQTPGTFKTGQTVIIKIANVGDDVRKQWNETTGHQRIYLKKEAAKIIQSKTGRTNRIPESNLGPTYAKVKASFLRKSPGHRTRILDSVMRKWREEQWKEFLKNAALDASNHHYITSHKPVDISVLNKKKQTVTVQFDANEFVPPFYFAGSDPRYGVYVIAMGLARGKPMSKLKKFTPEIAANLEKAILTFAAIGVDHGDLHTGNYLIYYNKVTIIDFGMTVILPEDVRKRAVTLIELAVSHLLQTGTWPDIVSNKIFYGQQNSIMQYMNSYLRKKKYNWYNPTGKMYRHSKINIKKEDLNKARLALWKRSTPSPPSPPRRKYRYGSPVNRRRIVHTPLRSFPLDYGNL